MSTAKKRRLNLADLLVIILILASVCTLLVRGNVARSLGLEDAGEPCVYTLLLEGVENDVIPLLPAGEVLKNPDTGEVLGTVRSVMRRNTVVYQLSERGNVVTGADPTRSDLTLIVEGRGKQTESGFLLNGSVYASAGDSVRIFFSSQTFTATVLSAGEFI